MAVVGGLSTFKGGHYFSRFEGRPKAGIKVLRPPKKVSLPLRQVGFVRAERSKLWATPKPLVQTGDAVKVGQIIARDDAALCSPVHAPISGKVTNVASQNHPFGGQTQVIVIEADGKDTWVPIEPKADTFTQMSSDEVAQLLYEAGVSGLGSEGFPTPSNSSPAQAGQIKHLVINAIDTEPYFEGNDELLYEAFDKFVGGLKVLRHALGNVEVHIGIGWNKPRLIEEIQDRIPQEWCYVHPLKTKYPQGEDEVLLRTMLELRVPASGAPSDVGCLVCDVQQAVSAYEAVLEGRPMVDRVVSVAGSALHEPANVRVRIGTPLSDFVKLKEAGTTVLGGVMRGVAVDDLQAASVLRDTKAIVALRQPKKALNAVTELGFRRDSYTNVYLSVPGVEKIADVGLHGMERPCLRCGYCFDVCPQNLAPIVIADYARAEKLEDAVSLDMGACIECGLCSYVCPSKIPVMSRIQDGKRALLQEEG